MEKVKILTVGAGAVGAYFTGRLAQAGAEVSVVVRSDYDAVKANGFEIISELGNFHFQPHGVYRSADEYPDTADYVFLTSKFFPETDEAAMLRGALKNSRTALVLIQNGIGIEDQLAEAFPETEILSSLPISGRRGSNRESSGRKALRTEIRAFRRRRFGSGAASGKTLCGNGRRQGFIRGKYRMVPLE